MSDRSKLLATVALPLASLIMQPAYGAGIRPSINVDGASGVIRVQEELIPEAEDGGGAQGERQEERRERRERRGEAQQEQQQEGQSERRERRERRDEAQQEQQRERQQERENAREERRERRDEAQQEGQGERQRTRENAGEERRERRDEAQQEERRQERENAREERRERRNEAQQEDQGERRKERENAGQEQPELRRNRDTGQMEPANEEPRERRNRDTGQREAAPDGEQDRQRDQAREERQRERQRARENAGKEQQRERRDEAQQEQQQQERENAREEQRERRDEAQQERLRDRENAQEERRERRDEAREEREEQRERRDEAQGERQRDRENARGERRERDPEREEIARDPSRSSDTIELPVEGGAAVLDSDKEADRRGMSREERRRLREERRDAEIRVPRSDADAQIDRDGNRRGPVRIESAERERGERFDRRPDFRDFDGAREERRVRDRVLFNIDNRVIVRSDDGRRLSRDAQDTYYEGLPGGRVREVVERRNGSRVITIRDEYGRIIQRSRINPEGREYVMFYAPDFEERGPFRDPGLDLPPMRLGIPVDEYIIDTSSQEPHDYREFLEEPPVEPVERVYTLDEVKYSARIRDKVRRIDLDTITFATGSAEISMEQASTLRKVADAMNEILDKDAGETFLIEGHTDAVGSDESNLVLSDERAESVANVLTDVYDIPPENMATQGYGERFLKVETDGAEQLNRRVTIRRVTPLVKPVALAE
ncbi:MAG: OmpA family protein [Shinella sp.]|nr:OmpA family protein [Shinella sp.]